MLYVLPHGIQVSTYLDIFASKTTRLCHSLLDITVEKAGLGCCRCCCSPLLAGLVSSVADVTIQEAPTGQGAEMDKMACCPKAAQSVFCFLPDRLMPRSIRHYQDANCSV